MDITQLTLILRNDKFTRGVFQGVYPSDLLPASVSHYPALFIANVDTSEKPGSHWVSPRSKRENFSILTDHHPANIQEHLLPF